MQKLLFLLAFFPLALHAQIKNTTATNNFLIKGSIKSVAENTDVYLMDFNGFDTLAKAKVADGKFVLTGTVETTDARIIVFPSLQRRLVLFMGDDTVAINGTSEFADIDISGAPANKDYEEFIYDIKPLNDYVDFYRNHLQTASSREARDSTLLMLNTAYNIYQGSIDRFLSRKKNSPVAALLLAYSYDTDPNRDVLLLEKRYSMLGTDALQSQFSKNLQKVIERDKVGAVGTQAPDFNQNDTSGKNISLSQFKGKYVLVDFWASWCKPCRMDNPNVVAAYNQFKEKNFTILSVSLDKDRTNWIEAIRNDNLRWTHVSDLKFWENAVAQKYNITSIPQNFLIDPSGKIIAKNLHGDELMQKLDNVLQ